MRLRRLEFVVIGVTLAFICFMGGFFTGRSWNAVNITAVTTQDDTSYSVGVTITAPETPLQEPPASDPAPAPPPADAQISPAEPPKTEEQPQVGAPNAGDGRININLATQTELTDLPGIGAVLASRIIDYRRQHGDFQRIEDLRNVSGIGEKRFESIQDKITVGN